MNEQNKKPFYKKWWFWVIIVVVLIGVGGAASGENTTNNNHDKVPDTNTAQTTGGVTASQAVEPVSPPEPEEDTPANYKNALKKAQQYSKLMHMSKQKIYDQLTSEYAEKFPEDAAQYAIDNLNADYNANALAKAKTYQDSMSMSSSRIYDQLVSDYGEKFTPEEARYAIDHLDD